LAKACFESRIFPEQGVNENIGVLCPRTAEHKKRLQVTDN